MKIWKAHYKDSFHDTDIEIVNTEGTWISQPLSFTLDGITFRGSTLGDFELEDHMQYDEAKDKFCILKTGPLKFRDTETQYEYTLQRYSLDAEIPITAVRKSDKSEIHGMIHLSFELSEHDMMKNHQVRRFCDGVRVYRDDENVYDFSLYIDGKRYSSTERKLCFEYPLYDICKQTARDYCLKCCFTCQYSDYSVYGNDDFGAMSCHRGHKEDYLKVNSKDEYLEFLYIYDYDDDVRQETYLCEDFDFRNRCSGYRGYVDGVKDM